MVLLLLLVSCEVGNVVSEGLQVLPLVLQSSVNQLQSLLQLSRAECIDIRVSIHALQLRAKSYQVMVELLDLLGT